MLCCYADMEIATPSDRSLWVDIDQQDGHDPLACSHIVNDIMANLFRAEVRIFQKGPAVLAPVPVSLLCPGPCPSQLMDAQCCRGESAGMVLFLLNVSRTGAGIGV